MLSVDKYYLCRVRKSMLDKKVLGRFHKFRIVDSNSVGGGG